MNPERWQQVDRLFQAALERAPEDRATFLDETCQDDPALRQEVESLLAYDERAGSFIQAPALEVAAQLLTGGQAGARVGTSLGPYRLRALLGVGGMGEVYLAADTRYGRKVALKLLPASFTSDAARLRRFQQEARAALELNHPNIITIYEIGRADGVDFIASEFVDGVTLRQRMSEGRMRVGEALDVAIQVAGALAAAHQAGIIHRDIKPENLMLRPDGYVKVLDFGLAKFVECPARTGEDHPSLSEVDTDPGIVMGTARYMSPEQVRGQAADARTDLFSLGVVIYEMVAGRPPFAGETASDTMAAILTADPPPLSQHAPGVAAELEGIVRRALARRREGRYQTAGELLTDLKRVRRQLELADEQETAADVRVAMSTGSRRVAHTGEVTNVQTTELLVRKLARYRRGLLLALSLLVLACVAGAVLYFSAGGRKQPINSIAILPFTNADGDPDGEYLSDGLAEGLINSLAPVSGLRVVPRSTVFRYKGQQLEPHEIGRRLGVQAVLTGRVTRRGETLSIQADLVDVARRSQLWGEQYTRQLADVQRVQGEIAGEIAERLRLKLTGDEGRRLAPQYVARPEAYQAYLHGLYFARQYTATGHRRAFDSFHEATRLDPDFARPHAALARIYAEVSSYSHPPREAMPKAREAVLNALALDESLAEAHHSLALIRWWSDWDYAAAEREFRRALELSSNEPETYVDYSNFLVRLGRTAEALAAARRALELDPISPANLRHLAQVYYYGRQYDRAIEEAQKALDLAPDYDRARYLMGAAYLQMGRFDEALVELQRAANVLPGDQRSMLGYAYGVLGRRREALKAAAELEALSGQRYISPYLIARIYAGLGMSDAAFKWLERGYEERSDHLTRLKVDPTFDALRADPRFTDLTRRVGLP